MKWFAGSMAGLVATLGAGLPATLADAAELVLKPSRELAPPAPKTGTLPAQRPAQPPARPVPQKPAEEEPRGALFLRADRLEGDANHITAEGAVELRSRYETVLADWLSYDVVEDEIWAKGNVVIRRGYDWITGPEVTYTRDTQIGTFAAPRFFVAEANGSGSAAETYADHVMAFADFCTGVA